MEPAGTQPNQTEPAGRSPRSHIPLVISTLAVLLVLVTMLSARDATDAVSLQASAGDLWSQYQAKKIRSDNTSIIIDTLQLQPSSTPAMTSATIARYNSNLLHWHEDLADEQRQARELEREVALAETKSAHYDLGEALLQIAIVLASITLFTHKQTFWHFGLLVGAAGLVISLRAFALH